MSLEELEKSMYSRTPPKRDVSRESPQKIEEVRATSWKEDGKLHGESPVERKARMIGGRLFWGLVIATLAVAAFGTFYAYQFFKTRDIALTAQTRESALIGQPFEISVRFANNLNETIDNLRISIVLPEGASSPGEGDVRVITREVGYLSANQTADKTFTVVNTDATQMIQKFDVVAYYNLAGSLAKINFDRKTSITVSFLGPAVSVDLSSPRQVFAGEIFPITVRYRNASDSDFYGGRIVVSYPSGFIFKGGSPQPTSGNSVWDIPRIPKGGDGVITIEGSVLFAGGVEFRLSAALKTALGTVDEKSAVIATAYSPVVLRVMVNDSDSYVAKAGDTLRYKIQYINNSEAALQFATISAKLSGAMFDLATLQTNGDFDSRVNTITWQANNTPALGTVDAKRGGDVAFSVRLLQDYPIRRLSDKNYTAIVDVQFSSPTVPPGTAAQNTTALTRSETKIAGRITVAARATPASLVRDRTSDITVTWTVSTFAADFNNITVRASLEGGVEWGEGTSSNVAGSAPIYDPRTKQVVWTIESLGANRGTVEGAAQASFTVRATPNILQTGRPMPLVSKTDVNAIDMFSGISTASSASPLLSSSNVQ